MCRKSKGRLEVEELDLTEVLRYRTLKEVADYYGIPVTTVAEVATRQFRVEPIVGERIFARDTIGAWMLSKERVVAKHLNAWEQLKETDLYKRLNNE